MEGEKGFIQVPIALLKDIFWNKYSAINKMIDFGVYHYMKTQEKDLEETCKDLDLQLFIEDDAKEKYNRIVQEIGQRPVLPMAYMSKLIDFRDSEKSDYELRQFAFYMGIRSILGIKPHVKTNKEMIVARAFGYRNTAEFKNDLKSRYFDREKRAYMEKYSKRYHVDKILLELQFSWHTLIYARNMRGMIIGNKAKTTLNEMALYAKKAERLSKLNELKNSLIEAEKNVNEQLKKEQHHNSTITAP